MRYFWYLVLMVMIAATSVWMVFYKDVVNCHQTCNPYRGRIEIGLFTSSCFCERRIHEQVEKASTLLDL